jgi:hypothetical protein
MKAWQVALMAVCIIWAMTGLLFYVMQVLAQYGHSEMWVPLGIMTLGVFLFFWQKAKADGFR